YFGEEAGDAFTEATASEPMTLYVMRPERWRTVDYRKSELANL
ncbi:MAG: pyridoxamine 5'-phosphate oxidase, partial [Myxococcales bacterium]|nr:pyridoxamine 5'-phosphate oxidase [Myxococcales bacterium]